MSKFPVVASSSGPKDSCLALLSQVWNPTSSLPVLSGERGKQALMPDYVSKLLQQVAMLYELEGWEGVEKYAKEHGIPVNICRKLLDTHVLGAQSDESSEKHPQAQSPTTEGEGRIRGR